jgi:hypothetical protein
VTTAVAPSPTHDQIKAAILDALPNTGLMRVPELRTLIPGTWWEQMHALGELEHEGRIYQMKVHGTPLVSRPLFPPSPLSCSYPAVVIP